MKKNARFVCLGGGIGTVNLIKGLKQYSPYITVIVSMADEGGSSGRLRRMYNMLPCGDLISCMAALSTQENPIISQLLTYRFPGDRYGKDDSLGGHKLGNLIMTALTQMEEGDFTSAITQFQQIFSIQGVFLPATTIPVSISAQTIEGKMVYGEENIDLGKYNGKRILEKVFLQPQTARAPDVVIDYIRNADVVIAGPGDLYTTILPVLIVENIKQALKETKAKKLFIVNVANKPFETKGYTVYDFMHTIQKHLGEFPFQEVIVNNNYSIEIPKQYHYTYVLNGKTNSDDSSFRLIKIIQDDIVDDTFPLYHSSSKLANLIAKTI